MAKILLENLTKRFGSLEAVKKLNLEVKDGEFVCLLGPSGCGKTTTLRIIAGLEKPTTGNIYIGDRLVNELSPAERDIAMVFQFYALYPGMTVFEHLAFPLESRKTPKDEIKKKVKKAAEILRIDHLLNEIATKLTVGEQQRVALGRAIVRSPQVYLLDEPLTNLDSRLRASMRVELKKLQRELGQTTIYVTHDQLEAITMADRIGVMDYGVLQQYDTPDRLYSNPKNLFVAGFIGTPTINFIDCGFIEKDGKMLLDLGPFTIDISEFEKLVKERATSSELILGIRPEDISVYRTHLEDRIKAVVYVTELIGDKIIIDLMVGKRLLRVLAPVTFKVEVNEKLWISFDKDKMHIFDKKTKEAIF